MWDENYESLLLRIRAVAEDALAGNPHPITNEDIGDYIYNLKVALSTIVAACKEPDSWPPHPSRDGPVGEPIYDLEGNHIGFTVD